MKKEELLGTKIKVDEILDGEFYTWVAPDGSIQPAFLAEDIETAIAMAQMFSTTGLSLTPVEMWDKGFEVRKVFLTIKV